MNAFDLLDAVGGVGEPYILQAQEPKRKTRWIPWAAAACVCIAVGIGAFALRNAPDTEPSDLAAPTSVPEDAAAPSETANDVPETGLWIPPIELDLPENGTAADMIALVMVDGNLYTESEIYYDDDAVRMEALLAEKLGDATGTIDVWSDESEYEKPLASNVAGEVWTVQGYDPAFRVAILHAFTDENGNQDQFLMVFDRLNGIRLATGADLFESRLQLRGRIASVQWQAHEDWDWNLGGYRDAELPPETWNAFLNAVDAGSFVSTWQPDSPFYADHPYSSVYDTPNQAHLFLTMEDGTRVELRLIEGGYVGYAPLAWYFVQIPGEVFDAVYDACGGTHQTGW